MLCPVKINFYRKKSFRAGAYLISALLISFILSALILGSKYGFGDSLPQYHLFENPFNDKHGDIIERHLTIIMILSIFFLICFLFSIIDSAGEGVIKSIKQDPSVLNFLKFGIPLILIVLPWVLILADYITLTVGYKLNENANSYFPTGPVTIFGLWILLQIVFQLNSKK
tara:strand:+ start:40 stop:549 length:510 start_codon:yes stop_codon:yes gene_type:complete